MSDKHLQAFADNAPVLLWTHQEGNFFVNGKCVEFFGVAEREMCVSEWASFIHADDREQFLAAYDRAIETREPFEGQCRFRRHDGEYRWTKSVALPRLGTDLSFLGYTGSTVDITDIKRTEQKLRKRQERYRTLFDSIDEGFCVIKMLFDENDHPIDYKFVEVNAAFEQQTGIERAVGRRMREIAPEHEEHWFQTYGRVARTGEPVRFENPAVALHRFYDVYAFRIGVPAQQRVGVLFKDITDRKRAEEVLRESDRRKEEFLAILGHELRNPLAPISNMLEVMKRSPDNPGLLQNARETIEQQVRHMTRLIDDLVDMSRISRGMIELRKEQLDLLSVVREAVEAVRLRCENSACELLVDLPQEPISLHADPTRLFQIVENLLDNACKYTQEGGLIRLKVERDDEQIVIQVRDNGIGIPPDKLKDIFAMFTQLGTPVAGTKEGLGLGLTVVRSLVEMHGGTVEAHSEGPGRGTEFILRLPIIVERTNRLQEMVPPARATRVSHRILIVDDNRAAADSLRMLVELGGHEGHVVYDGIDAVDSAARLQPDVILLDIDLPGLTGYEVARRIRQQQCGSNSLLVAVTGWGHEEARRRSHKSGFDLHIAKPVKYDELEKLIAEVSRRRGTY